MTWRTHLTEDERTTLTELERIRGEQRVQINATSAAIARIRNTCVQRDAKAKRA